jgi:hypothetical protein
LTEACRDKATVGYLTEDRGSITQAEQASPTVDTAGVGISRRHLGLASSDFYLLAIDVVPSNCGGRVKRYWKRSASDDTGFGSYEGYWYESYSGTWSAPNSSSGFSNGQYMQRVHSWY